MSVHSYIDVGSWSSLLFICSSATFYALPYIILCRHSFYVPLHSRHNIIDCNLITFMTISTMEFGVPNSIGWYLRLAGHCLCLGWFPRPLICFIILCTFLFCFRWFLSFGTYWSILYRLCSKLTVSLLDINLVGALQAGLYMT